jgi:hypothetical protein
MKTEVDMKLQENNKNGKCSWISKSSEIWWHHIPEDLNVKLICSFGKN